MDTLITNIRQLLTPIGAGIGRAAEVVVREDVELWIRDRRIAGIEAQGRTRTDGAEVRVIDAERGVVIPGLIDPHTHWSADRGRCAARLRRQAMAGVTTVELKFPAEAGDAVAASVLFDRGDPDDGPHLVPTLFGSPGGESERDDRISSLIQEGIPTARRRRLALFCDVACGPSGYGIPEARTVLRAARGAGLSLKVHAAGSADGRAARLACELDATSVDGLNALDSRGVGDLRRSGVIPVLLPAAAFSADRPYPAGRAMLDAGLPVALASDRGGGASEIADMWIAVGLAVRRMEFSTEEAIAAATLHAAQAVRRDEEGGSIEPGKSADLLILDLDDYREIGRTFGAPPIRAVLIDGRVVGGTIGWS